MKLVGKFSMLVILAGAFLALSAPQASADACSNACYRKLNICLQTHSAPYCTAQWNNCMDACGFDCGGSC
jgi:hypothetical protein